MNTKPTRLDFCHKCGGLGIFSAEKDAYDEIHYWVNCHDCNAYVVAWTFDEAVEKWNKGELKYANR